MEEYKTPNQVSAPEVSMPDMTDIDEVRKAVIAGEILNRKY